MRNAAKRDVYENSLWQAGMRSMAGIDEVGRGALAGPLVASAVYCGDQRGLKRLLRRKHCDLVRDSKTLTHDQRLQAKTLVCDCLDDWAIGVVSPAEIDLFGIAAANRIAMERALSALSYQPDFLLIDAMTIDSPLDQWGIIDGDAHSLLIGAASIVAKVARDAMMDHYQEEFHHYAFSRHRGYGTPQHLMELREHGPCELHRTSFEPVRSMSVYAR